VLDKIEHWTEDFNRSSVFLLGGLAGTGKSAIAQTVAERAFADGRLGASFFCSRGIEDHCNLQLIFPTLAFQLAQKYPCFRSQLVPLLQSNPRVIYGSLQDQMQNVLVTPLISANISTVIVVDALDECEGGGWPDHVFTRLLQLRRVKFFIASRRRVSTSGYPDTLTLHYVEPRTVDNDIRLFFRHELSGLAHRHGGIDGWPTDKQLDMLCQRAAGFFLYAVATVSFLSDKLQHPSVKLDLIMESPESTTYEGKALLNGYTSLDSLYMSILQESCKDEAYDGDAVRSILSAMVLAANPLLPSTIATLIGLDHRKVQRSLEFIRPLLALPPNSDHPVQPFHKSFPDFIMDPARCAGPQFYIPSDCHIELFLHCLETIGRSLDTDMCSIPAYVLNSEVKNLSKRIDESGIRGALEYACRSWHKHLIATKRRASDAIIALRRFLEQKCLFWLEVLSVLDAVDDAVHALGTTLKWLTEVRANRRPDRWDPSVDPKSD
jgi:hypothetical protein